MKSSKKIVISVFAAAVLFSVFVLAVECTDIEDEPRPTEPKAEISAKNDSYRVKAYNGHIAVFIDGNETPLYTLETPLVRELPEYDQTVLENGITASSNSELLQILEDYDN